MNSDVVDVLLSLLDNDTLSNLQHAGLGPQVLQAAEQQFWWYNRASNLFFSQARGAALSVELKVRPGADWRSAYPFLENAQKELAAHPEANPFVHTSKSVLATEVLIELGYDPSVDLDEALGLAADERNLDVILVLLSDPRVNPGSHDNYPLSILCNSPDHTELAKSLLLDPRVDPSDGDNFLLLSAVSHGNTEIVKVLLSDPRVDPNEGDRGEENPMTAAIEYNQPEVVRLLLADPRIDVTEYGAIDVANRVLRDELSGTKKSLWYKGAEAAHLFLSDLRVRALTQA